MPKTKKKPAKTKTTAPDKVGAKPKPTSKPLASTPASQVVLDALERKYGQGVACVVGGGARAEHVPRLHTGSLALDTALGGGLPLGRIVEVYGPAGAGKTTLVLHTIAAAQQDGMLVAFVDAEHALDVRYAQAIGVNLESLILSQPDFGEQALNVALDMVESGVKVVVVDSVAALTPKAEIDGEIGDSHVGLQARMMGQALRKMAATVSKHGALVLFVNQLRLKVGVVYGSPEVTSGGHALGYYSSVRLDVRRRGKLTEGEDVSGCRTLVKVVKNKVAPPFREAEFDIRFGVGIDKSAELLDMALACGEVVQSGAWFTRGETKIGQGRQRACGALRDDIALFSEIKAAVLAKAGT